MNSSLDPKSSKHIFLPCIALHDRNVPEHVQEPKATSVPFPKNVKNALVTVQDETSKLPRATHTGPVEIVPGTRINASILPDGRRVLSNRDVVEAISSGAARGTLDRYIDRLPNDSGHLQEAPHIQFRTKSGQQAEGHEVTFFVQFLKAYKNAWRDGKLRPNQIPLAQRADILLDAFSEVGINALIDEALGVVKRPGPLSYSALRDLILLRQPSEWELLFGPDFARTMHMLYRKPYEEGSRFALWLIGVVGRIYNVVIGKPVLKELRVLNPNPRSSIRDHQFLTPEARSILQREVRIILVIADESRSAVDFWNRLRRHYIRGEGYQQALFEEAEGAS